jgi:hypothetical protein
MRFYYLCERKMSHTQLERAMWPRSRSSTMELVMLTVAGPDTSASKAAKESRRIGHAFLSKNVEGT